MVEEQAPAAVRGPGVDLADDAQRGLIERIFWARYSKRVEAAGLDPNDVLQRVFLSILVRNAGRRPFDPALSTLSNYAWMVLDSVTKNEADKARRARARGWNVGLTEDVARRAESHSHPLQSVES